MKKKYSKPELISEDRVKIKRHEVFKRKDHIVTRVLFHIADQPEQSGYQRCKTCMEKISAPTSIYWDPGTSIFTTYNKKGEILMRAAQDSLSPKIWSEARPCSDMSVH